MKLHFEVWPKTTIDYDALANGIIALTETMSEDYQAALAVGMLPAPIMEILEKQLNEKLIECCCKNHDMPATPENMSMFLLNREKFNEVIRNITVQVLNKRPVKLA